MRHLPNLLSVARFPLGLAIFLTIITSNWTVAFWLFIAAVFTDYIDGPLARRLHATSSRGNRLDHDADLFLFVAIGLGLTCIGILPWYCPVEFAAVYLSMYGITQIRSRKSPAGTKSSLVTPQSAALGGVVLVIILASLGGVIAVHAFGWQWWELVTALAAILVIAVTKRDRLYLIISR